MKEIENKEVVGAVNIIAKGTQFEGNIITNGDCRIDGIVKGNITSKAKIVVGRSGIIEGNIVCTAIDIEGIVKAETLNVIDLISLKATANVMGNICTGKIAIEPGAEFSGNCKMHNQKTAVPQPEPQPKQ